MIQQARKPPTIQKFQPKTVLRYTGSAMTNQTSRAPKRNSRAADSTLIAWLLERMSLNFGLAFALPRSFFNRTRLLIQITASTAAIARTAPANPSSVSSAPPRKNPTPLSAFFEPVRMATHLYSVPCWLSGTRSLIELLADILFRSLAIPDNACAPITQGTVSHAAGTVSINSATTCIARPRFIVRFRPSRAPR